MGGLREPPITKMIFSLGAAASHAAITVVANVNGAAKVAYTRAEETTFVSCGDFMARAASAASAGPNARRNILLFRISIKLAHFQDLIVR